MSEPLAAGGHFRPELNMSHQKSREVVLPIRMTPELQAALDGMCETWRRDPAAVDRIGVRRSQMGDRDDVGRLLWRRLVEDHGRTVTDV